jgi:hypothetical protein
MRTVLKWLKCQLCKPLNWFLERKRSEMWRKIWQRREEARNRLGPEFDKSCDAIEASLKEAEELDMKGKID